MELDFWIPQWNIAIEYQGEHHYYDVYHVSVRWRQKHRDEEKRMICLSRGITLIEVPYRWDFERSSLIATIRKERKDLLMSFAGQEGDPIPEKPLKQLPLGKTIFVNS